MKLHEAGDLWRVDVIKLLVGAAVLGASFMFLETIRNHAGDPFLPLVYSYGPCIRSVTTTVNVGWSWSTISANAQSLHRATSATRRDSSTGYR